MKKTLFISLLIWCSSLSLCIAQQAKVEPIKWTFEPEPVKEDIYKIVMEATLEDGWCIYPQVVPPNGPLATSIVFNDEMTGVTIDSITTEIGELKESFDAGFEMNIPKYCHKVRFETLVVAPSGSSSIGGQVDYMVCNAASCITLQKKFQVLLRKIAFNLER